MTEQQQRKVAIITGGGSGIGRDLAVLMAEAGYAVIVAGRTGSKLNQTAELVKREVQGAVCEVVPTDVTDSAAVDKLVGHTVDTFGRVDALANCAGSAPLQPIEKIDDELLRDTLDVNLCGVVYTTRACWPVFKKQKAGAICNVSSMASIDPFKGFNIYAAAKAGVNLFTKCAAEEGQRMNLIAAAVAPGAIETELLRQNFSTKAIPEDKTLDPVLVAGVMRDILTGEREVDNGETIALPSPA